jgi:hypothetical protein
MVLEGIRPRDGGGVYLNEELVLTFSRPVDPVTVTADALSIRAEDGSLAQGRWEVEGRVLRFVPRPVLRPSLDDGGYHPGTAYELIAAGFPRLDGLRGVDGEPLAQGFRWSFETVGVGPERQGAVFDDVSPDRAAPLRPDSSQLDRTGARLAPWEPLVLTCSEPLDPSTLRDGDFRLIAHGSDTRLVEGRVETLPVERPVPLVAVLRANRPERGRSAAPSCEIELFPQEPLQPGEYSLSLAPALSLTDFRGNPVPPGFSVLSVRMERPARGEQHRRPTLPFLDVADRSPLVVPGTDGLALWGGGRVSVRYPAAAGNGGDGALLRGYPLTQADVQTTRVELPSGEELTLASGRGLRVLRAQRGLSVGGSLRRSLGPDLVPRGPGEGDEPFLPGETLSSWLERAGREDWDWTVLIAGGDLVVSGLVEVDTPLLLVAGGWIRVEGSVRHSPRQLWLMGDGGGVSDPTASVPGLILDGPTRNPLVEPLRLAVVSSPLPRTVRTYRWLGVDADGYSGAGRWTVGFLPPDGPVTWERAVGHPRLLPGTGPLRVLIGLEVPPGPSWDPPFVDYVDLRWEIVE